MSVRELIGRLPGWMRSRYALLIPLVLVVVPVAVSLLRDSQFETTLEVFPTTPPGNAGGSSDDLPAVRAVVANPGFQVDAKGWQPAHGVTLRRSTEAAYSGAAALASIRTREITSDGRIASTEAVLPAAGRYSVQAWVRLPSGYSGGPPEVALEGFSGSERVGGRTGDPSLRGRWQLISGDYTVEAQDVEGRVALRTPAALPEDQVLHWDDVRVLSNEANLPAPDEVNLVANPGFEHDRSSWGDGPAFEVLRSERLAHTGRSSLRSSSQQRVPSDTNAAHTYLVFPRAGIYRVRAWVYISPNGRGGQPGVFLEGFSGSTQLAQKLADPGRRGVWQPVSTDYEISPQDLEGSLVLRDLQDPHRGGDDDADAGVRVVHWDDVSATVPRPDPPSEAPAAAATLRSALEEPQLRSDMARLVGDDNLYDPRRVTVRRSARDGTLSFVVSVATDLPSDANRLAAPLRSTLLDAARRATRRQAQKRWQGLIAIVGDTLPSHRRALLSRRAKVLERMIGAQPADVVAPPSPAPAPSSLTQAQQLRIHEDRQKIISRIAEDLPPWQRALVQLEADNLQRMIAADTARFVVLPPGSPVEPTRLLDRLVAQLPGPFPPRVGPVSAAAAGLMCALLLAGMLITMAAARPHPTAGRR